MRKLTLLINLFTIFVLVGCALNEQSVEKEKNITVGEDKAKEVSGSDQGESETSSLTIPKGTIPVYYESGMKFEKYRLVEFEQENFVVKMPIFCSPVKDEFGKELFQVNCGNKSLLKLSQRYDDYHTYRRDSERYLYTFRDLHRRYKASEVNVETLKNPFFNNKSVIFFDELPFEIEKDNGEKEKKILMNSHVILDEVFYEVNIEIQEPDENKQILPLMLAVLASLEHTNKMDVQYEDGIVEKKLYQIHSSDDLKVQMTSLYKYGFNLKKATYPNKVQVASISNQHVSVEIGRYDRGEILKILEQKRNFANRINDEQLLNKIRKYPFMSEKILNFNKIDYEEDQDFLLDLIFELDGQPYYVKIRYAKSLEQSDEFNRILADIFTMVSSLKHTDESIKREKIQLPGQFDYVKAFIPQYQWGMNVNEILQAVPFSVRQTGNLFFNKEAKMLGNITVDEVKLYYKNGRLHYYKQYRGLTSEQKQDIYKRVINEISSKLGDNYYEYFDEEKDRNIAQWDSQYEFCYVSFEENDREEHELNVVVKTKYSYHVEEDSENVANSDSKIVSSILPGYKWELKKNQIEELFDQTLVHIGEGSLVTSPIKILDKISFDNISIHYNKRHIVMNKMYHVKLTEEEILQEYNQILKILTSQIGVPQYEMFNQGDIVAGATWETEKERCTFTFFSRGESFELYLNIGSLSEELHRKMH